MNVGLVGRRHEMDVSNLSFQSQVVQTPTFHKRLKGFEGLTIIDKICIVQSEIETSTEILKNHLVQASTELMPTATFIKK